MTGPHHTLSAIEVSELIRDGALSPIALTAEMLGRINKLDDDLHSYVTVMEDRALKQAECLENELAMGEWRGPLHGVPIALKDIFYTKDVETSCGTKFLQGWIPDYDATVVTRLEKAGAILLGKLVMGEAAYLPHPDLPKAVHPWHNEYWPGASSSGSGVACAAGLCFGSLGTDTGGSIRYPSSVCGIVGMKPTWGRISRHGVFPFADTLDHVGPMARTVEDAAILFDAIAGPDPNDPATLDLRDAFDAPPVQRGASTRGLRIGADRRLVEGVADADVNRVFSQTLEAFQSMGHSIVDVSLPDCDAGLAAFGTITSTEAATVHGTLVAKHGADYGPILREVVYAGLAVAGTDYAKALRVRREYQRLYAQLFAGCDVLLVPVSPDAVQTNAAFEADAVNPERALRVAYFAAQFNLTGLPCLTVPAGFAGEGLPFGLQLVGPALEEQRLFDLGMAFQQFRVGAETAGAIHARPAC